MNPAQRQLTLRAAHNLREAQLGRRAPPLAGADLSPEEMCFDPAALRVLQRTVPEDGLAEALGCLDRLTATDTEASAGCHVAVLLTGAELAALPFRPARRGPTAVEVPSDSAAAAAGVAGGAVLLQLGGQPAGSPEAFKAAQSAEGPVEAVFLSPWALRVPPSEWGRLLLPQILTAAAVSPAARWLRALQLGGVRVGDGLAARLAELLSTEALPMLTALGADDSQLTLPGLLTLLRAAAGRRPDTPLEISAQRGLVAAECSDAALELRRSVASAAAGSLRRLDLRGNPLSAEALRQLHGTFCAAEVLTDGGEACTEWCGKSLRPRALPVDLQADLALLELAEERGRAVIETRAAAAAPVPALGEREARTESERWCRRVAERARRADTLARLAEAWDPPGGERPPGVGLRPGAGVTAFYAVATGCAAAASAAVSLRAARLRAEAAAQQQECQQQRAAAVRCVSLRSAAAAACAAAATAAAELPLSWGLLQLLQVRAAMSALDAGKKTPAAPEWQPAAAVGRRGLAARSGRSGAARALAPDGRWRAVRIVEPLAGGLCRCVYELPQAADCGLAITPFEVPTAVLEVRAAPPAAPLAPAVAAAWVGAHAHSAATRAAALSVTMNPGY